MLPNKIVILLTVVIVINSHHHHKSHHRRHLIKILKSNNNLIRELSRCIQKVMNGVFMSLDLSEQFSKQRKIKVLLTMQADLNKIAEKNFKLYDVVRNASALDVDNKPINQVQMNDFIVRILNKNDFNISTGNETKDSANILRILSNKPYKPEFANSKEFKQFISGFIGKLKALSVEDIFDKNETAGISSEWEESGRRNLNVWDSVPQRRTETRRIFGGQKTDILSYPFMASIHVEGDFVCAGSIISRHLILTAASCLQIHHNKRSYKELPKHTYVRLGSDWTCWNGELVPVQEIYFYPKYDPISLNHNLAIIRILKSIKLQTHSKVSRILLYRSDWKLHSGNVQIEILGWGSNQPNQILNQFNKLNVAVLNVYDFHKCQEYYSKDYVTGNHFCAGSIFKGTGACTRDVGGPAIIGNLLVGITSFGSPVCGSPDSPTVFTRVWHYIDWIDHIISLHPKRYGLVSSGGRGKKMLVRYKKPTIQHYALNKNLNIGPINPEFRADNKQDDNDDAVLSRLVHDINYNHNRIIHEVMNHDIYDNFVDIFKPEAEQSIMQHPLINKTDFLYPGIHYTLEDTEYTMPPATTTKIIPSFLLRFTPSVILRAQNESNLYNVSFAFET